MKTMTVRNIPNARILDLLNECDEILMPAATYAELTYGFLRGGKMSENESMLNSFLLEERVSFQPVTQSIAERWGYVKASLEQHGTPIPDNDIWIAATALKTGARLISYDRHFDSVGGLIRLAP